jgi:Zn finger protein HypA/HybF involved in hydrogenase expression
MKYRCDTCGGVEESEGWAPKNCPWCDDGRMENVEEDEESDAELDYREGYSRLDPSLWHLMK